MLEIDKIIAKEDYAISSKIDYKKIKKKILNFYYPKCCE